MVVYPCDIPKVPKLLTGKDMAIEKRTSVRRNDDQFLIWPLVT